MSNLTFGSQLKSLTELASNLSAVSEVRDNLQVVSSTWGRPSTILPVCALLTVLNKQVGIEHQSNKSEFVSYLKIIKFPVGVGSPNYSQAKSYLPIARVTLPERNEELNQVAGEYGKLILSQTEFGDRSDLITAIHYLFGEMTTNVVEHARASNYWLLAQKWKNGWIEFCIVDDGMGIRNRFAEEGILYASDKEAVTEAIQGTSVKSNGSENPSERGYGLGSSIKVLTGSEFQGSFALISGEAVYTKKHGQEPEIVGFPFSWPGVIIVGRLKFPSESFDMYKYLG